MTAVKSERQRAKTIRYGSLTCSADWLVESSRVSRASLQEAEEAAERARRPFSLVLPSLLVWARVWHWVPRC
jgi:hypothetical protein